MKKAFLMGILAICGFTAAISCDGLPVDELLDEDEVVDEESGEEEGESEGDNGGSQGGDYEYAISDVKMTDDGNVIAVSYTEKTGYTVAKVKMEWILVDDVCTEAYMYQTYDTDVLANAVYEALTESMSEDHPVSVDGKTVTINYTTDFSGFPRDTILLLAENMKKNLESQAS